MLPLGLYWAFIVLKMHGSTVQNVVIYLGHKLFTALQAYVARSRVAQR